ncbi:MAG: TlyA family RNA methyltransferase [Kiritimatiellae bacterium]|nr:TlyA family RNA methyltransferase [Kiritimatiellia bacterium]
MSSRIRLDSLLFARGLAPSRTAAQALVLAGKVRVDGRVETKCGRAVAEDAAVEVEAPQRFVSRGGEKLEGAFEKFPGWTVEGLVCLDVGSSTGGFTDCMLQHGAARVMAVDVGTNQLAYKLRSDPRVWVRENFNARYLTVADIPERPARAVTDVSFISLRLILPTMAEVLLPGGEIVSLVKPQFEAGRGEAPGGVVTDPTVRERALAGILDFGRGELGLELLGVEESPIRGREKGNIEYLAWWRKPEEARP